MPSGFHRCVALLRNLVFHSNSFWSTVSALSAAAGCLLLYLTFGIQRDLHDKQMSASSAKLLGSVDISYVESSEMKFYLGLRLNNIGLNPATDVEGSLWISDSVDVDTFIRRDQVVFGNILGNGAISVSIGPLSPWRVKAVNYVLLLTEYFDESSNSRDSCITTAKLLIPSYQPGGPWDGYVVVEPISSSERNVLISNFAPLHVKFE